MFDWRFHLTAAGELERWAEDATEDVGSGEPVPPPIVSYRQRLRDLLSCHEHQLCSLDVSVAAASVRLHNHIVADAGVGNATIASASAHVRDRLLWLLSLSTSEMGSVLGLVVGTSEHTQCSYSAPPTPCTTAVTRAHTQCTTPPHTVHTLAQCTAGSVHCVCHVAQVEEVSGLNPGPLPTSAPTDPPTTGPTGGGTVQTPYMVHSHTVRLRSLRCTAEPMHHVWRRRHSRLPAPSGPSRSATAPTTRDASDGAVRLFLADDGGGGGAP